MDFSSLNSEASEATSRPEDDDTFAYLEVNNGFCARSQTGGNASIGHGCNQSTNTFETDEEIHVDAHPRRRRSNLNCSDGNLSIDHSPEDNIFSGHGRDKKGLSMRSLNSQDQTQTITRCPTALAPTSSTGFQQVGEDSVITNLKDPVLLPRGTEIPFPCGTKKDRRNFSGTSSSVHKFWNKMIDIFGTLVVIVLLVAPMTVKASSVAASWQVYSFCPTNTSLMNQTLTIKDSEKREALCTFNYTAPLFWYNYSESGHVFANDTCVEEVTKDQRTGKPVLEYGKGLNGQSLSATHGGTINDKSLKEKIARYSESTDSTPQPDPEDRDHTVGIIVGVLVTVALLALLVLLYYFCPRFKRWAQPFLCHCRGRNTNNAPEISAAPNPECRPLSSPATNGTVNGHLGNEERLKEGCDDDVKPMSSFP